MTRKDTALRQLLENKLIAVIREKTPNHVELLADALSQIGITAIEITLTTPGALALIAKLSGQKGLLVGAGSVLTTDQAKEAFSAGAQFYASPCFNPDVLSIAQQEEVISMPGGFTPTELFAAWNAGADIVKLFPVPSNGVAWIRSILAPMPEIRLAPSGGITADNAHNYIQAGATVLNVGSWLTPNHETIETRLKEVQKRGEYLLKCLAEGKGV